MHTLRDTHHTRTDSSNIRFAYADHERQEELLENSDLDWTLIRPVGLINTTGKQQVLESINNEPKHMLTIGRKSLGRFFVESLKRKDLIGKKVVVSGSKK